jgi:pimeloyl-ACP methyl ester carboxylesterase
MTAMKLLFAAWAAGLALCSAAQAPALRTLEGRLPEGASYRFDVPPNWTGQVLLFSHGYARGPANPARNAAGAERDALLARGYALIGSSYRATGWAVVEAVQDQLATLDVFTRDIGPPRQVLAWGSSMGGLVTLALLEQHGARFDGGLALCASASGTLGMLNQALDGSFVFATLAAPTAQLPLRLNASGAAFQAQMALWQQQLATAQATPLGRARTALAAVVAQVPDWADGQQPRPAANDLHAQQQTLAQGLLPATLLPRDDQERRAGGNFSWNTGVDYADQLRRSGREALVRALYDHAGASLQADLDTLAAAPRTAADPAAVRYMHAHYVPSGQVSRPVLLLQTVADPVTLTEFSEDYRRQAQRAGQGRWVRTAYVDRVGHCNFTAPELLAAVQAVLDAPRQDGWVADSSSLQRAADAAGARNKTFIPHEPVPLLRSCGRSAATCAGLKLDDKP